MVGVQKQRFIIVPADICNLTCSFCCVAKCEGSSKTLMSVGDAKKYANIIANYLVKHKIDFVELQFFGGEPMLNLSAIKEFLLSVQDSYRRFGVPNRIKVFPMTNAMCNIPEFIEFIHKLNLETDIFKLELQMSFDGPKELCTDIAEKTDITYIKRAIELTKNNKDWMVSFMVVISNHNAAKLLDIVKFINKHGVLNRCSFRFDIENSDYVELGKIVIPQLQDVIKYIKSIDTDTVLFSKKLLFSRYLYSDPRGTCGSGIHTICLSSNGILTGCQRDVVLISQKHLKRVYRKLTSVNDIEDYCDLSFDNDWYQIGKDGHAEYEDICPAHYEKVKDDPDRKEFFRKVHEIVKQLDEGDKSEEEK